MLSSKPCRFIDPPQRTSSRPFANSVNGTRVTQIVFFFKKNEKQEERASTQNLPPESHQWSTKGSMSPWLVSSRIGASSFRQRQTEKERAREKNVFFFNRRCHHLWKRLLRSRRVERKHDGAHGCFFHRKNGWKASRNVEIGWSQLPNVGLTHHGNTHTHTKMRCPPRAQKKK